jgi:hypothetical protein
MLMNIVFIDSIGAALYFAGGALVFARNRRARHGPTGLGLSIGGSFRSPPGS